MALGADLAEDKNSIGGTVIGIALSSLIVFCLATPNANAESDLRQKAQNPISSLISAQLQNNVNLNVGRFNGTQYIGFFQPVIPMSVGDNWNLIVRPIIPLINQPRLAAGQDTVFGIGDINPQIFFSPKQPTKIIGGQFVWGVGPSISFPTATDRRLGSDKYSAGPGGVLVVMKKPFVFGALINNLWSFAGDDQRADVNALTLNPFLNYNMAGGWYLASSLVITANWEADDDNRWTAPLGGGVGRVFHIGSQAINAQLSSYYNVISPDDTGADWQIRTQITLLFPK